jgi:O-antigen ligase
MKKIFVIALTTFLILIFVVLSMGGGHGFFWPAKIIYPYSMIIGVLNNQIEALSIIIAVIQIPIYGIIISKKSKWIFLILGIHIISAVICLYLPTETFNG